MSKLKTPRGSEMPAVAIALMIIALLVMGGAAAVIYFTGLDPFTVVLAAACGFAVVVLIAGAIYVLAAKRKSSRFSPGNSSVFGNISLSFIQNISLPVAVTESNGRIVWHNTEMQNAAGRKEQLYGKFLDSICSTTLDAVIRSGVSGVQTRFVSDDGSEGSRIYNVVGRKVTSRTGIYMTFCFYDLTEIHRVYTRMDEEDTVVAYIMIDNLDEISKYIDPQNDTVLSDVSAILFRFADSVDGVIRGFGQNKYICIFKAKFLPELTAGRFSLLDEVREVHLGDAFLPVTISIGLSTVKGTLHEKSAAAEAALDMALRRGGDQAVVKTADGIDFYGGKTKGVQKRTRVRARVVSNELLALIAASNNVLVMGHKYADYDAFASCMAIAKICMFCGVKCNIIANRNDPNLRMCFEKISKMQEYRNVFVDALTAQDLCTAGTLTVLADVNNVKLCEAPDILANTTSFVVIDHHRKMAEFATQPLIEYIEPAASSASELMAEMLEQILPKGGLTKDEADLLLTGILLDTKQFTRNTGVRTFSSALYLREEGASPSDVQEFFKTAISDFLSQTRFESNVVIYKSIIAIALNNRQDNTPGERVTAAKVADHLLSVSGVAAAFALCRIGDTVHISARSQGMINVQLLLEKIGGGGHFDSAGAQISDVSVADALSKLRAAIDDYLESGD
ncbi:MAG: DHH family phosphoesterase [Clostridia bacterium]|nr:DHH family phosphoesterase [Clostridia bacterium]